jgi:hypothetical protein
MLQRKISDLRENRFPTGADREQVNRDIDKERETIEYLWADNLHRRRRGKLTDRTAMDAARKIISDSAKLGGFTVRFREEEYDKYGQYGDSFSTDWHLTAMYDGDRASLDIRRWNNLIDRISIELAGYKYTTGSRPQTCWSCEPSELPKDYELRDYSKPGAPFYADEDEDEELYEDDAEDDGAQLDEIEQTVADEGSYVDPDPYRRPAAIWIIGTWIWNGPPKRHSRRT